MKEIDNYIKHKIPQFDVYIFKKHEDNSIDFTVRDNYKLHQIFSNPKVGDCVSSYTTTFYKAKCSEEDILNKYGKDKTQIYNLTED